MSLHYRFFQLILSSLLICFTSCCNDDPSRPPAGSLITVKTIGGSNNERAESVISTTDGGFALFGYTQSNDGDITGKTNTSFDYWLVKYSEDKTIEWQKTYGGSGNDRGRDIIQTLDGGYAILGASNSSDGDVSSNAGQLDFWLVKLDAAGEIEWESNYGFSGNDEGIALIQTRDLGYLITGVLDVSASGGEGNSRSSQRHAGGDYWAIKIDPLGQLEWSRYYGGNFTDTPEGVIQTQDNGYILAGGSDSEDTDISNNIGSYDFWVIRISETGELLWEKNFGGTEIDEAKAIVSSNDGNFVIVGDTRSNNVMVSSNNGAADIWLIKIDADGNLLWEKNFGGSDFDSARDIKRVSDGYLITGSSRSADGDATSNQGQNDMWVLKVDFNGQLQWQRSIGGSDIDFGYGICNLSDGTIISVGDSSSNDGDVMDNKGFTDVLLAELKN